MGTACAKVLRKDVLGAVEGDQCSTGISHTKGRGTGGAREVISMVQICWEIRKAQSRCSENIGFALNYLQAPGAVSGPYQNCCLLFPSLEQEGQCLCLGLSLGWGQLSWRGLNELPVCILATFVLPFGEGVACPLLGHPPSFG